MTGKMVEKDCPMCGGTGRALGPYDAEVRCKLCGGFGHVWDIIPGEGVK